MRDLIRARLEEIPNANDRAFTRKTMEDIFLPLYDEVMGRYTELEQKIYNEFPLKRLKNTVLNTVLPREKADGYYDFLFPVVKEDLIKSPVTLAGEASMIVDTVFFEADYLLCREIILNKQKFQGKIYINSKEYPAIFQLQQCERYNKIVEELYAHFISNGLPWITLNFGYIQKFFDIILVEIESNELAEEAIIEECFVDFGRYNSFVKRDFIPVWNVEKLVVKSKTFPVPAEDKKKYVHTFELDELGKEHSFLADFTDGSISSIERSEEHLFVNSDIKNEFNVNLVKITSVEEGEMLPSHYPLLSNYQREDFADRLVAYYGTIIKTKAEIQRIIGSFELDDYVIYEDISFSREIVVGETYNVNSFMKDEIRDNNLTQTLVLRFTKATHKNDFILRDIISFVTTQIQQIYPEFLCVGVLI